jgi:hypothetical protein
MHEAAQMHMPLPRFLRRILARMAMTYIFKYPQLLAKAAQLAEEEFAKTNTENSQ